MQCKITDLRNKEIINIANGMKMGGICDIEIDTQTGELVSIIVYGRQKAPGLLGREEDIVIPWKSIKVIGDDTIIVDCKNQEQRSPTRKRGYFESNFKQI